MTSTADPHAGQAVVAAGAPLGAGRVVVVMVHGRGAAPSNILDLVPRLACPDVTYLAPTAADRTWYPLSFMAPRAQNEPALSSALRALGHVAEMADGAGVPPARVVVLGFSQGACLATEFVARAPVTYGGLVAFSGGLIGSPGTTWPELRPRRGLHAFLGCSDVDAHVPWTRVQESAAVLERLGASVDLRRYPGLGHVVDDDEIVAARAVIAQVAR